MRGVSALQLEGEKTKKRINQFIGETGDSKTLLPIHFKTKIVSHFLSQKTVFFRANQPRGNFIKSEII